MIGKSTALVVVLMFTLIGLVAALPIISMNNPGHVRILKGNRAGLQVTPSTIEFGNVTLTVNPGNVPQQPSIYSPFTLQPGMTIGVLAIYTANQTLTMPPGDYMFTLTSEATCL